MNEKILTGVKVSGAAVLAFRRRSRRLKGGKYEKNHLHAESFRRQTRISL